MNALKSKKEILFIIFFTILLTSCTSQAPLTQEESIPVSAQFAQITLLETKPKFAEGNKLLYGKLQITLPDGVTIEEQDAEQDRCVIDLIGAERIKEKPFPPRVWLAHYHAVYKNEYDLTSALLEFTTPLRVRYKTNNNRRYVFTFRKDDYKQGYVLVYEDDIYILEELAAEQEYSFGELLDEKAVKWGNDICEIGDGYSEEYNTIYNKIQAEENDTFLAAQSVGKNNMRTVLLFRDGYFTSPESIFSFAESSGVIAFEDYNFDGCPDMIVPSPLLVYLWNTDTKTYEEVQMPEGFLPSVGAIECFPETKTIYREEYDNDKNKEENWAPYYRTETLWQWEGTVLTKKRECIVEKGDENVHIWAYENGALSQNTLFDETVSILDWKKNSAKVQTCYQKFYAGMLPETNNEWLHPIDYSLEHREYIPQALLDEIAKAMPDNTLSAIIEEYAIDKNLTSDEMAAVSQNNIELRCDLLEGEQIDNYIMTMTDADNDGIKDIIVEKYYDNAKNFTDYEFFQGQKDGTYQKTYSYSSVNERFDLLTYDGKRYLCRTSLGYGINESVSLVCYEDGIVAETVDLFLAPKEYHVRLTECADAKYETFAEEVLKNSVTYKGTIDMYKKIDGKSEERSPVGQYQYQCDLNNDNVSEQYNKSIWTGNWEYLDFSGEGEGIECVLDAKKTVEGTPMMLWVEPFDEENIINIISLTELDDFEITGFLINEKTYKKLYRITANAIYEVCQERSNM